MLRVVKRCLDHVRKTVLSQFLEDKDIIKMTVYGELNIFSRFTETTILLQNHASRILWKSRFTWKKLAISHFTGKKRADHESPKYRLPPSILFLLVNFYLLFFVLC